MDERLKKLARNLVRYSVSVGKDDKVYIHYIGQSTEDLARLLVKEVYETYLGSYGSHKAHEILHTSYKKRNRF